MKSQEDIEKTLKHSIEVNKEKPGQFTPSWNAINQEKTKTLRQIVYSCLKEGDYATLDNLLLKRSARDIEKFYGKEASKLLHLAFTSCPPSSLDYLIEKIPQKISCEVLGKENFSFLRAFIAVGASTKNSENELEKKDTMEKLYLLSKLQDESLIKFLKENSNFSLGKDPKSFFKL